MTESNLRSKKVQNSISALQDETMQEEPFARQDDYQQNQIEMQRIDYRDSDLEQSKHQNLILKKAMYNPPNQTQTTIEIQESEIPDRSPDLSKKAQKILAQQKSHLNRSKTLKVVQRAKKDEEDEWVGKPCILLPNDKIKMRWDVIVTFLLMFTCFITPWRLAFYFDEDRPPLEWQIIYYIVDFGFFLDIIMNFCSAYVDKDSTIVSDRKLIACKYLRSWFFIDLIATIPLDLMIQGSSGNQNDALSGSFKGIRTFKLYKLTKLTRLLRILKVIKDKQKLQKAMKKTLGVSGAVERLSFFVMISIVMTHIMTCLWIINAKMQFDVGENWIVYYKMQDAEMFDLYIFSAYFTVTTITTVGYGDITAHTDEEQIYCILQMITGVIGFSLAQGVLASLLNSYDDANKKLVYQMNVFRNLQNKHKIGPQLIQDIQSNLYYDDQRDVQEESTFIQTLPPNLRDELSTVIHQKTINQLRFFKKRSQDRNFISWVCPQLKSRLVMKDQYIFQAGDTVQQMFFQETGKSAYVMPRYENFKYVMIQKGDHFGLMDVVQAIEEQKARQEFKKLRRLRKNKGGKSTVTDDEEETQPIQEKDFRTYKRQFNVQAVERSGLSTLSISILVNMQFEFGEYFKELLADGKKRLINTKKQRRLAIQFIEEAKEQANDQEEQKMPQQDLDENNQGQDNDQISASEQINNVPISQDQNESGKRRSSIIAAIQNLRTMSVKKEKKPQEQRYSQFNQIELKNLEAIDEGQEESLNESSQKSKNNSARQRKSDASFDWSLSPSPFINQKIAEQKKRSFSQSKPDRKILKAFSGKSDMFTADLNSNNKKQRHQSVIYKPNSYVKYNVLDKSNKTNSKRTSVQNQQSESLMKNSLYETQVIDQNKTGNIYEEEKNENIKNSFNQSPNVLFDELNSPKGDKNQNQNFTSSQQKLSIQQSLKKEKESQEGKSLGSQEISRARASSYHFSENGIAKQNKNDYSTTDHQPKDKQDETNKKLDKLLSMCTGMSSRIDSLVLEVNQLKLDQAETQKKRELDLKVSQDQLYQIQTHQNESSNNEQNNYENN